MMQIARDHSGCGRREKFIASAIVQVYCRGNQSLCRPVAALERRYKAMSIEPTMSSTYAFEVAFVDHHAKFKQRFNEAVARGDYPCAPRVEGRARVFTARDVMGIWLYGHLLDDGIPPAKAGGLACEFVNVLQRVPDLEEVLIVRDAFRRRHVVAPENLESFQKISMAGTNIVSIETWDLRQQHKNIAHQFAKLAARHVHPDDAEE